MREDVYYFFKEISKIPRETYHIEKISNYLVEFAKERGLEVYQDPSLNVMMRKKASIGYEDRKPIILQAHMDMVCQKVEGSFHDFQKDGVEIINDNGFLMANGTTLGADDGIGMAMVLALLDGNYLHPKIEVLFTVNEEVGMDGAFSVDMNWFSSNRLINLDSEDEGILTVGCAGGVQFNVSIPGVRMKKAGFILTMELSGLRGGHSGVDIDKNRVNAIRFLVNELSQLPFLLISIDGGKVDNAICDQVSLSILLKENLDIHNLQSKILAKVKELGESSAVLKINCIYGEREVFDQNSTSKILSYLKNVPDGVISYYQNISHQLCASLNMGIIRTDDSSVMIHHLIRSSSEKERKKILHQLFLLVEHSRGLIHESNSFPIWSPQENSSLRRYLEEKYFEMFGENMKIEITHGGLECGVLVSKKKDLDCVSIGPNVMDVHTPKERVEIESVNRMFDYLLLLMKDII